jgi:hypothetical protein
MSEIFDVAKLIPERIFTILEEADQCLDKYIPFINVKNNSEA